MLVQSIGLGGLDLTLLPITPSAFHLKPQKEEMSQTMALNRLGSIFLVFFLLSCVAVIVNAENDTAEDEYWKERAAVAMKIAEESVHPNPQEVTEEINADVHEYVHVILHSKINKTTLIENKYHMHVVNFNFN